MKNIIVKDIFVQFGNFVMGRQIFRQFFKYSIVGVFNTIIGLGTIFVLFNVYQINYIIANIIGYSFGLINSFMWNKKWTFKSSAHYSKEMSMFFLVFIVSYAANLIALIISVEVLGLNHNISFVLSSIFYFVIGFMANRKWTFSHKRYV